MKYHFYGQHGEDYLLWHFFDFRRSGFFLDIGAHDGISLSNTKSFEEQGWTGICVEPAPEIFATCQANRARVVQAACVDDDADSVELRVDRTGLWAGIHTDEVEATRSYGARGGGDPAFHSVQVPAVHARDLLVPGDPPVDFVSVDVEGTEIAVLRGLDLARNRPRLLLIEALTEAALAELDGFLRPFGYHRARSIVCNHAYVTTERDARKLRGITIDCDLTVPDLPGYGPAGMATHAWSPPTTRSWLGFIAGKLKHRYRRLTMGV